VIPGIVLIVNSIQEGFIFGMALALTSAFLAALFGTLNKFYIAKDTDPVALTFLQLSSSWLFLCLLLWPVERTFHILDDGFFPSTLEDWGYMALLALLCTTIGYVLAIRSLRHLPAFAFNLTINLEPVYGMLLAWAILEEHKSVGPKFYIGAGLIVLIVSLYPWLQKKVGNG